MDFDVCSLTLETAHWLVNQNPSVRQSIALALGPRGQQKCAHAGGLSHAYRLDIRSNVLHRVVNGQTGRYHSTRRIDVKVYVLVRLLALEEEQLSYYKICYVIIYCCSQKNYSLSEKSRINVVRPLPSTCLFNYY